MARRIDYERSDLSVRGAVIAIVVFSAALVLIGLAIWLLEQGLRERAQPVAGRERVTLPARDLAPRLQRAPAGDLAALEAREARILGSAAWMDRERGVVRIPVARAMEALAERGWPEGAP